ncbi:plasmalemma vesicle-associated protein-like isoform X2 [Arapaima gigas]
MYNSSSYSQARLGLEPRKLKKSKEKSCSYYMRIIFFFSSLIQSLIIISLVLFLVYGRSAQLSNDKRIQDLENVCQELKTENLAVQQQKGQLNKELNLTLTIKAKDDAELLKLRTMANHSFYSLQELVKKLGTCEQEKFMLRRPNVGLCPAPNLPNVKTLQERNRHLEDLHTLVNNNFTQMVRQLKTELGDMTKECNEQRLANINLKQDKTSLEKQLEAYTKKCKEDFMTSLQGINTVTKTFLNKIESSFPGCFFFHLSCPAQKGYLEQIQNNCTSLSSEVEDKFQQYLYQVADTITEIQRKSSKLTVENTYLTDNLQWCQGNSSAAATESSRQKQELQEKYDKEAERLLKNQKVLYESKELLDQQVKIKDKEINFLSQQIHLLNTSLAHCIPRPSSPNPVLFPLVPPPNMQSTLLKTSNPPYASGTGTSGGSSLGIFPARPSGIGGSSTSLGTTWLNLVGGAKTGTNGAGVSDAHTELSKHLKELQKYTNTGSEVSG